ncbi:MAG TPA: heat-inducible transcriptional repressor HrcA [Blastocatellia bacterium]|jgi:heat shock gene repressor HrcA|nr:heat-inducible transcriptional repressor HrcA [Blastocatellia bacterium]
MTKRSGNRFDDRKREIFATIVKDHIATGQPVGSFALANKSRENLSSATIRNICAELEDEGYLTHPHTSAGRLPTDRGYRFYVDNFISSTKLSRSEAARINERLLDEESLANPDLLMERTSRLLSQLSDNVGIVVSPSSTRDILQHIEFVRLPDARILVITVSRAGRVQNRVIRSEGDFAQDELNATSRYLIENFHGWTLAEIRDELLRRMSEEKALYDQFLRNAVLLCSQSLQEGDQPDVFIEGASNIIAKPDFADTERMRALFKMFEQKSRIVKILNECIENASQAVAVRIGSENRFADLRDCTVIASTCVYPGGATVGSIGVVGPTRLEYERLIAVVDYIARLFDRAAGGASARTL